MKKDLVDETLKEMEKTMKRLLVISGVDPDRSNVAVESSVRCFRPMLYLLILESNPKSKV